MTSKYSKQFLIAKGVRFQDGSLAYQINSYGDIGYISAEAYLERPSAALAMLARQGIIIVGPRRAALSDQIAEISDFEDVPMCWRVGWSGSFFALPDGEVICPDGVESPGIVFNLHPEKVHKAGTQERWLADVAEPLTGHRICEFFMTIPFAGPLRSLTNRVENFGWEIVGDRATGKSTLLSLMASICGGPVGGEDGNFGLTFAATPAAIEGEMRNYADLFMGLDEANLFGLGLSPRARGNAMSLLFMSLGKGQDKARYLSKVGTYRNVFATSANEPLAEVIAGTSDPAVLAAVADRLMTISLKGRRYGIFDRSPAGYVDPGDCLAALVDGAVGNHGMAMRHYLRAVVIERAADPERFAERIKARVEEFCQACNMERNNGSARRIAEAFGLVFTAGRIARRCGALPQGFDPLASTFECYRIHAESISTEPRALVYIRALAKDPEVIDLDRNGTTKMTTRELESAKGFIKRNRRGDRELLVHPRSMQEQFEHWNQARRDFAVGRLLVRDGDGHHTAKRDVRTNKGGDRMVCINLSLLGEQGAKTRNNKKR